MENCYAKTVAVCREYYPRPQGKTCGVGIRVITQLSRNDDTAFSVHKGCNGRSVHLAVVGDCKEVQRMVVMINALPRNARAKPIERFFYTFKEHYSKSVESYCGGKPDERPEDVRGAEFNVPRPYGFVPYVDVFRISVTFFFAAVKLTVVSFDNQYAVCGS